MKYFVTNVSTTQYSSTAITIRASKEEEVSQEVYAYLNETFGASGRFTFRTEGATKKAKTVKAPEAEEAEPEVKATSKRTKSKK